MSENRVCQSFIGLGRSLPFRRQAVSMLDGPRSNPQQFFLPSSVFCGSRSKMTAAGLYLRVATAFLPSRTLRLPSGFGDRLPACVTAGDDTHGIPITGFKEGSRDYQGIVKEMLSFLRLSPDDQSLPPFFCTPDHMAQAEGCLRWLEEQSCESRVFQPGARGPPRASLNTQIS